MGRRRERGLRPPSLAHLFVIESRDVGATPPESTLLEAAKVFAAHDIGAIRIVDTNGIVVGILSERDLVDAIGRKGAAVLEDPVSEHMNWRCPPTETGSYASLIEDLFGWRADRTKRFSAVGSNSSE